MDTPLHPSPPDQLLIRYMLGEATEAERAEVEAWLDENPANRKYYEGFEYLWKESRLKVSSPVVNEEEAWERFRKRVGEKEKPSRPLTARLWFRAAAMAILFAGAGWLTYEWLGNTPGMITRQAGAAVLTDTLPDGSVVTLNKGSSLSYTNPFSQDNQRSVALEGEAFFEVTPDKEKPFVITVNDVTVKVVGTSFNVKGTPGRTEVVVETGQVKVETRQQELSVSPEEKVTVEAGNPVIRKEHARDSFHQFYRTGKLVCRDIPLEKVVAKLGELYGVEIRLADPAAGNLVINTTFEARSLPDVLEVIAETFNLSLAKDGDTIILK